MKTLTLAITTALGLASVQAASLAAQGTTIDVELRAGFVHPTTDLGRTAVVGGAGSVTFGQADTGPLLGAGVAVAPTSAWGFRVMVDHGFARSMTGLWECAPFVACPAVLIEPQGDVSDWTFGADVRFTPSLALGPLRPSLFAGAGIRRFHLEWASPLLQVPIPTTVDETNAFARMGAGVSGHVRPIELFGEVTGTFGPFGAEEERFIEGSVPDGRTTNVDVGLVMGLRVHLR